MQYGEETVMAQISEMTEALRSLTRQVEEGETRLLAEQAARSARETELELLMRDMRKWMTAAATANAGGQVLWAYVVEREGADAGKIVGTTTGDSMTINSVRVNAINMADVHVASSATFLRERGWPAEYFVGTEITGVTFEGISTIIGTEVGLNWLLVTGQNNTCNPGHIWRDGLCWKCENGFQPKEHIVGAPDECMPCGVSQAGMHGHCKQNGSRFGGSGGSLYIPTP